MVSVPAPLLKKYMDRSHMIFLPAVVEVTTMPAWPLTPFSSR
jgi:hypothetical protein